MKKKYSYIGLAVIILIFGVIVIPKIVERTANNEVVKNDRLNNNQQTNNGELAYIVLNGEKAKVPNFEFVDQNNDTISNEDYLGKVYVVDFFFTTCPTICPKMTDNMMRLQKKFRANPNFAIASFSINPENDTPEKLKAYAKKYNVQNPNWHFLTGDRDKIYELANEGFNLYVAEDSSVKFFTTCPTICPKMTDNMMRLQKKFRANPNFAIASFSINPENDTPEKLKAYAKKYNVQNPNWHFLTGDRDKIYELANEGFNLYVAEDSSVKGNFQHSGYFALIDQEGYLRSRLDQFGNPIIAYNGLEDDDLKMLKEDINQLL